MEQSQEMRQNWAIAEVVRQIPSLPRATLLALGNRSIRNWPAHLSVRQRDNQVPSVCRPRIDGHASDKHGRTSYINEFAHLLNLLLFCRADLLNKCFVQD